jgi:hypothetical protein
MTALGLAVLLASALAADLPVADLIERLREPDRVVREEAARTLLERGDEALPALRAAREAAGGAEARDRLGAVIAAAETARLARPTMVALDCDDRPLGEALQALSARSGHTLSLDDPALAGRRVTVRTEAPVPFWEALDRLGRAGHVRHDPGPRRNAEGNDPDAALVRLVDGDPPGFTAYGGPLRVHLFATHRHVDLLFRGPEPGIPAPAAPPVTAEVQVYAEPGRFVDAAGAPRLEAVDARGRPLPAPAGGGGEVPSPAERSWLVPGRLSLLQWHVPLALADRPPGPKLRLRCVLPVVISAREPDPLVIPLADAAGKTFRHPGGMALTVERVNPRAGRSTDLRLKVTDGDPAAARTPDPPGFIPDPMTDLLRNRLEFQDDAGRALTWLLPFDPAMGQDRVMWLQPAVSSRERPARLLVYRLRRVATEVAVEFDGVPVP